MIPESSEEADIVLMLEGTYPYVLGGVSSWVDQIVKGLPEFKFGLFFIGSTREQAKKPLYTLPPNIVSVTEVFMHDRLHELELTPASTPPALRKNIYEHLGAFYLSDALPDRLNAFWKLIQELKLAGDEFTFGNLMRDPEAWEIMREVYGRFCPDESFIDFFWTSRFVHLPLWALWKAHPKMPKAKLYHSISTGYAGFAGAIGAKLHNIPYLVTEHGIYTKERLAEISQADWIYENESLYVDYQGGLGKLKQLWMAMFGFLGHCTYETASQIVTLYEGNTLLQIEHGANPDKIRIIPNGIDPSKFNAIYDQQMARWQSAPDKKYVGFIGRVVPIKDVKTLIRAARLVIERMPEVEFLIAGPYSEDPTYFDECQKIAKLLRIDQHVHFMGMQKIMEVLPKMDVMVLTSISEGLPLVSLEAMAAGLPQVSTDVGACRELIFGRTPEDKALGRAGRLTKILSPAETASALLALLNNPSLIRRCGESGRKRAESFYSMKMMLDAYRDLYGQYVLPQSKEAPASATHLAA